MHFDLPFMRMGLYGALSFFTLILMCLAAARLNYTNHLPHGLNGGHSFTDPIVVEILVATLLTIPWSIFVAYSIYYRYENKYISTFRGEIIGLSVLWMFWIAAAAGASTPWGNLGWCQQFEECRVLSALVGFAWLGWLSISILLGIDVLFTIANSAMTEPMHGRWNPRQTQYIDNVSRA